MTSLFCDAAVLIVALASCMLTPFVIFVAQSINLTSSWGLFFLFSYLVRFADILAKTYYSVDIEISMSLGTILLHVFTFLPFIVSIVSIFNVIHVAIMVFVCLAQVVHMTQVYVQCKAVKLALDNRGHQITEGVFRLQMISIVMVLYCSFLACLWFYIGCQTANDQPVGCPSHNSWTAYDSILDIDDVNSRFIRSLHFVIQTIFTIGFGDIHPINGVEISFTLFLLVNASLFYALLISAVSSFISCRDISTKNYRNETDSLKAYLNMRSVSESIRNSVRIYYEFLYTKHLGTPEQLIFDELPKQISNGLRYCYFDSLRRVPMFSDYPDILLHKVNEIKPIQIYIL